MYNNYIYVWGWRYYDFGFFVPVMEIVSGGGGAKKK